MAGRRRRSAVRALGAWLAAAVCGGVAVVLTATLADAKPERLHLLAFPVMNVLHRRNLKDKLGTELKTYLRSKHVKEIVAYAGFPATELGPKQLEEVRVNSDRDKGKIVRVLRPGFVEEKTGAILQKVQAEVSR